MNQFLFAQVQRAATSTPLLVGLASGAIRSWRTFLFSSIPCPT